LKYIGGKKNSPLKKIMKCPALLNYFLQFFALPVKVARLLSRPTNSSAKNEDLGAIAKVKIRQAFDRGRLPSRG